MMSFVHSRRSVPTSRPAIAFAFGAHTGVSAVLTLTAYALAMKPPPYTVVIADQEAKAFSPRRRRLSRVSWNLRWQSPT